MSKDNTLANGEAPLQGGMLIVAALVLALANFVAVLDMTIANVSVATIAGAIGVTNSQATWVITSYAVAEAIIVPLTGWLAGRFGTVRTFVTAMALFGMASFICGFSNSLGMLVAGRILQGLAGGPMMPLSQTLLLRIFPKEKAPMATALWAMTTLVAPILGPITGGFICDNYHWSWIFYINVPIALICAWFAWGLLKRYESPLLKAPIDKIGLVLLVVWVGALQLMLDEGKELDWFSSPLIIGLTIVAIVGFAAFMIWETTERHPIVDLRVFRHRGYAFSVLTLVLAFGGFFGLNVLTPQWLQQYMGYTSTWSGITTAWSGVLAVLCAPLVASLLTKIDGRKLVFFGVSWLGGVALWRAFGTTDMGYSEVALPLLVMGVGLPFFFVPLTGQALASVEDHEVASAAGLMNFLRTLAGAFATSITTAAWDDRININHADLVSKIDPMNQAELLARLDPNGDAVRALSDIGSLSSLDRLIQGQSVMLATNQIFAMVALVLFVAAFSIWLAPRATKTVDTSAVH
ncbi:DHA2 family efflux MFS transporter permease subunit [Viridibacterium curvum]|uniref:Multidrug efflux MFS transporter permease subunit VceB n=1 Tax=Viridibacterium curvum TaxID=1101404 RepID=A0ABP9QGR2_9RHOO